MADWNKEEEKKPITIADIARELGLSKTTISRAISGKGRIGEETRNKVLSYIEEHNYRPNRTAKALAQSKTFNIGVVLPADSNLVEIPYFQSCLMGVCEVAASHDYDVVVTTVTETDISRLVRMIQNTKVDGVILTRTLVEDKPLDYVKSAGIPFLVTGSSEDKNVVQVDVDHENGCAELTSVLLMSGNQRVAFLSGNQNHIVNRKRFQGFWRAFAAKGKEPDASLIFPDLNSTEQIDLAVDAAVANGADCMVCSDDLICSRVMSRLDETGCRIPEDIRVASFYNSAFLENHNPPVTALSMDVRALGAAAARNLLELIAGNTVEQRKFIDYNIVLKKSTQ